jgi:hypothetical protein
MSEVIEYIDSNEIVDQIKLYANKIKCTEFQGKGTIDDYSKLFTSASKVAVELNVDVEGFNEFATYADELSKIFENFIIKLQNVNIINDSVFLNSILNALIKIDNLSNTFGKFKDTILATSTIQVPISIHETASEVQTVLTELNCAMKYINYFVNSNEDKPTNSDITQENKDIINKAIENINNFNILTEQDVINEINSNLDLKTIQDANLELKNKSIILKNAVNSLKEKFNSN